MDPYTTQLLMMNHIGDLSGVFVDQMRSILLGVALVIAGLLCAAIVEYISMALLKLCRWDKLAAWAGLTKIIHKVRPDISASVSTAQFLFWLVFVSFLMQAFQKMNIGWFSVLGRNYFEYLPSLLDAALIVVLTTFIMSWIGKLVFLVVDNAMAYLSAGLSRALIASLGLYMALLEIGINRELLIPMVLIMLAAMVGAVVFTWIKQQGHGYHQVIRVSDVEEG